MTGEADVLFERRGALGLITLNRPKALNALTREMCLQIERRLLVWAQDPDVRAVAIAGAGDKAFCAGGDIRALYEAGRAKDAYALDFYRDEYRLNTLIHHFPKPYVGLIDGITMGGGVGVSVHGSHRVATERTVFSMPETGIGLFPDIGASFFLPRCPGYTGLYLGLTGARLNAADAIFCGIASAYVPSGRLPALLGALADLPLDRAPHAAVSAAIGRHLVPYDLPPLAAVFSQINQHFILETLEDILSSLDEAGQVSAFARETAAALRTKSPTSLKITCRLIRECRHLGFEDCMRREFRISTRVMTVGGDFYEGVRAVLIDKDNAPNWAPNRLEDVSDEAVDAYFAGLGDAELALPGHG